MTKLFKYFYLDEFQCSETGENQIDADFVYKLDELREACDFPFVVNSGYRSPDHSVEKAKKAPGTHAKGIAADIKVSGGAQRMLVVAKALELGFTGIGVAKTFVHVDTRQGQKVLWVY